MSRVFPHLLETLFPHMGEKKNPHFSETGIPHLVEKEFSHPVESGIPHFRFFCDPDEQDMVTCPPFFYGFCRIRRSG
jgi:hypothetical protein